MTDFTGKAALITGGTRGIGLGIAQEIVDRGGSVCITARKPDELEEAVKTLDPDGTGRAISARGSADDEAHQQEAVAQTVAAFGRLDFLVNNAAVNHLGPVAELSTDDWDRTIGVDLSGPWYLIRAVVPDMITRGRGSIVNITSVAGFTAPLREGPYSASKAALHSLTRTVATELGPQGIRCNSVAPGLVWTRFMEKYEEQFRPELERTPLGRFGQPDDVADVVAFLVSDESRFITGEVLNVSGGWYLRP